MATVTNFEDVPNPSRSDLRQFAELFRPLFIASTEDARRQAAAALSQNPNVPKPVALFIASQPIGVSAPFLIASPCLDDEMLMLIARTQGEAHARTIVRRENLSPTVIDALVGLRHAKPTIVPSVPMPEPQPKAPSPPPAPPFTAEEMRREREERLRSELRDLVRHLNRPQEDRLGLRTLSTLQEALLIRFARTRETASFATALADALSASRWLAERILLDISGTQLATTLIGTGMMAADCAFVLERFYPHLGARDAAGMTQAEHLIAGLDADACGNRVEAWRRADSYTFTREPKPSAEPLVTETHPLPTERRSWSRMR